MKLLFMKKREGAVIPKYATPGSAGCDLSACIDVPLEIKPGEIVMIPTGLAVEYQGEENVALLVYARSSLAAKHGLALANSVGVVDSDYRGEIMVAMINQGSKSYTVSPNERIAQLVVTPVLTPEIAETDVLSDTQRGSGGFGSTN